MNTVINTIRKHPLPFLLTCGIILRLTILFIYRNVTIYPDSQGYIELAQTIIQGNLCNYTGARTPGFPTFLAILNINLIAVVFTQFVLGLLGSYFLYLFCVNISKSKPIAFLTTLIYIFSIHVIFYEFAILTESLTTFLLLLILWYISKYKVLDYNVEKLLHYFIVSGLLAFIYLTRPMFIYISVLFTIYFIIKTYKALSIKRLTIILLFPTIAFYSWNTLNKKNIDQFTSSYYLGYTLSQTAIDFFHKAPNKDHLIRDVYVKHRDSIALNTPGGYPWSIWRANNELLEKTHLKPHELSKELKRISIQLFKDYPLLYLKQVCRSWKSFWGAKLLLNQDKFSNKHINKIVHGIWYTAQKPLIMLIKLIFIIISVLTAFKGIKTKKIVIDTNLLIILLVILGSIAQALIAFGSNDRFSFPYYPFILFIVIHCIYNLNFVKKLLNK